MENIIEITKETPTLEIQEKIEIPKIILTSEMDLVKIEEIAITLPNIELPKP